MTKTKWHFRLWLTLNQFSVKINTTVTNNWSVGFLLVLLLVIFPDAEKSKVITYKELWWTRVLKTVKMIHCSHHLCFSWYIFKNVTSYFSCSWWTPGVVPFPSLFNQSVFNLNWTEQDSWMRGETPSRRRPFAFSLNTYYYHGSKTTQSLSWVLFPIVWTAVQWHHFMWFECW